MSALLIDLTESLGVVLRSLKQHIADEAKTLGVKPSELCPCMANEVRDAERVLAIAQRETPGHRASDGCWVDGPRGPDCGCQSCRSEP